MMFTQRLSNNYYYYYYFNTSQKHKAVQQREFTARSCVCLPTYDVFELSCSISMFEQRLKSFAPTI